MKHSRSQKNKGLPRQSDAKAGFAMLFTVLIISVILAIGLGISDITYKQTILSNLAKDSQLAFYQADSGVECGMYYDITSNFFPRGVAGTDVPATLQCGNALLVLDSSQLGAADHFVYNEQPANLSQPCYTVTFDKTDPVKDSVSARGFSTCTATARQVERALNVTY